MWTFLIILGWLLAALVAVLLAVIILPLRCEIRASAGEVFRYKVRLQPFARSGPRLAVVDSERLHRKTYKVKRKTARRRKDRPRRDPRSFLQPGLRLVREFFERLHIDNAMLDLRFGAANPSDTGQIYGALVPFVYGSVGCRHFDVKVEPVFDRAVFNGRAALDIRLTPVQLVLPLARFGWRAFGPRR